MLAKKKTVIIKEALANGRLFRNNNFPEYDEAYSYLEQLSIKYNVGSDAIAIRFIIDALEPTLVLSGGANISQIKENFKAHNFELDRPEMAKLKSFTVSPPFYWEERSNLEWN